MLEAKVVDLLDAFENVGLHLLVQWGKGFVLSSQLGEVVDVVDANPDRYERILFLQPNRLQGGVSIVGELLHLLLERHSVVPMSWCESYFGHSIRSCIRKIPELHFTSLRIREAFFNATSCEELNPIRPTRSCSLGCVGLVEHDAVGEQLLRCKRDVEIVADVCVVGTAKGALDERVRIAKCNYRLC